MAGLICGISVSSAVVSRPESAVSNATKYVIRAVGDTSEADGPRRLSWLSPIAWGQQFRPYAGNRWWVLLITLAFAAVVTVGAYLLVARRDMGAGLLPDRPGPAGGTTLRSSLALAWRLRRGLLLGELGPAVDLSQPVMDISPYAHVPKPPAAEMSVTPAAWLLVLAVAFTAAGLVGLRRRDIG